MSILKDDIKEGTERKVAEPAKTLSTVFRIVFWYALLTVEVNTSFPLYGQFQSRTVIPLQGDVSKDNDLVNLQDLAQLKKAIINAFSKEIASLRHEIFRVIDTPKKGNHSTIFSCMELPPS